MATDTFAVILKAQTQEFTHNIRQAGNEVDKLATRGQKGFHKLAGFGKAAVLGIAGGAVALGTIAVKEALEGEKAQARLANAIKNSGGNYKALQGPIKETSDRLAKFGFVNDEVEISVANLTRATKKPALALKEMGLAADIARGRNMSLEAATAILVKVQTGHVALLGRLGIATKDAKGKTISQTEAIKRLGQMYGGQAGQNAKTFAGKTQALQAQMHNLTEELGQKLIPILVKVIGVVVNVVNWLDKHKTIAKALAAVIGGVLVAATVAWAVSLFTAGGALAFLISPIAAVVIAVGAITAAIVLLWKNWDKVWNFISHHKAIAAVIALILPIIPAVFAIIAAIKFLQKHWDTIWPAIQGTIKTVAAIINGIVTGIYNTVKFVGDLIWNVLHGRWGAAWDMIRSLAKAAVEKAVAWIAKLPGALLAFIPYLYNGAKALGAAIWQGIIDGIKNAPGTIFGAITGKVGSGGQLIPGIPHILPGNPFKHFAMGGMVPGPIGQPVAAIVHGGERVLTPSQQHGGNRTYNITVNSLDPRAAGPIVIQAIKSYELTNGPQR